MLGQELSDLRTRIETERADRSEREDAEMEFQHERKLKKNKGVR